MSNTERVSAPWWYWIAAVVGLLWNLMGLAAYLMHVSLTPEEIAALPQAEQALHQAFPSWALIAFSIAVYSGTLGCVLLLARRAMAKSLLILSLLGVLVQNSYSLLLSDAVAVYGNQAIIMPTLVIIVGALLIWLCTHSINKKWILA
ncbi:hypothetical protein [Paraferrimonas haliotis]|uniref:Sugar transporter n=1 Tax=Paraferrimonas haliotis TaxID=2013866 RepID=A0AA37WYX6_9GAMM|nr:hypothetical protein [Paraferrimonas haliotis]GLS83616.1 hypothetical protein GCM10007894_15930 [Paraferrimonas haliotis]